MIDVKLLREQPAMVKAALSRKKFAVDVDTVLRLDEARRAAITGAEQARAEQKAANQEMARLDKKSPEFQEKLREMKGFAERAKELEAKSKEADAAFQEAFFTLPNLPDPSIPEGRTEADNVVVKTWGEPGAIAGKAPHWEIPWFGELVDFERGVKVTGAGFPFLLGDAAKLERKLIQFLLEEAEAAGYLPVAPPLLVNAESARATGQLPDKEGQMYWDSQDGLYLIPTAEVPVTNLFRDEILAEEDLPIRASAYTPCFRREAGSWGAHVRGLNRLHQFDKVELVKWTTPETSGEELESLRGFAEGLLEKLGLPYRTLLMCAGDIGFPHFRQYDLEVWAAGQGRWLEVSSCSNFTDFQARRANIRYRDKAGKVRPVHTLNGSALGLARVLAALLENGYEADTQTVRLPACLAGAFSDGRLARRGAPGKRGGGG